MLLPSKKGIAVHIVSIMRCVPPMHMNPKEALLWYQTDELALWSIRGLMMSRTVKAGSGAADGKGAIVSFSDFSLFQMTTSLRRDFGAFGSFESIVAFSEGKVLPTCRRALQTVP